jgi:hypothetical protein
VELGPWIVGLRSNDQEVVEVLRGVLAPLVVEGVDVFPNLSLLVGQDEGRNRPRHTLWRRREVVLRTSSLAQLVRAALWNLEALVRTPEPGALSLRGEFVLGPGGAVLVHPRPMPGHLSDQRLARWGWRRGDGLPPLLDRETSEVIVPQPQLATDPEGLAELDRRFPVEDGTPPLVPGRYPLQAILLLHGGSPDDAEPLLGPAERLAAATALLPPKGWSRRPEDIEAIAAAVRGREVQLVPGNEPRHLNHALEELASRLRDTVTEP